MDLCTTRPMRSAAVADQYFRLLEERGFTPARIDKTEPIRTVYTRDMAVEMWTHAEPACRVDGVGMVGEAGGVLAKGSKPAFWTDVWWWDCPDRVNLSYLTFHVSGAAFARYADAVESLFLDTIVLIDAEYGYITDATVEMRQHEPGTLRTRMPGVFWANYFGPRYVAFFTPVKLDTGPWVRRQAWHQGLVTWLAVSPHDLVDDTDPEERAKDHLGRHYFGDRRAYEEGVRQNPRWRPPHRPVPDLRGPHPVPADDGTPPLNIRGM